MKKILFLVVLISLISCSKSKEDEIVNYSITGKWYQKESVINDILIPYSDNEPCGKDYIEFYGQNNIKSIDVFNCQEDLDWIGSYSKIGNNLIIINGSETLTTEILELTNNSLIYKYHYDFDGNGSLDTIISKYSR